MSDVRLDPGKAKKGTVCRPCWSLWKKPRHKTGMCRDVWLDPTSPSGTTVCMCGCASSAEVSAEGAAALRVVPTSEETR